MAKLYLVPTPVGNMGDMSPRISRRYTHNIDQGGKQRQINQFHRSEQENIDLMLRQISTYRKDDCHHRSRRTDSPRGQPPGGGKD